MVAIVLAIILVVDLAIFHRASDTVQSSNETMAIAKKESTERAPSPEKQQKDSPKEVVKEAPKEPAKKNVENQVTRQAVGVDGFSIVKLERKVEEPNPKEFSNFMAATKDDDAECIYSLQFKHPITSAFMMDSGVPSPLVVLEKETILPEQKLAKTGCQGKSQVFKYQVKISPSTAEFVKEDYHFGFQPDFPWNINGKDWYWLPRNAILTMSVATKKSGTEPTLKLRVNSRYFGYQSRKSQLFQTKNNMVLFEDLDPSAKTLRAEISIPNEDSAVVLRIRSLAHMLIDSIEIYVDGTWKPILGNVDSSK